MCRTLKKTSSAVRRERRHKASEPSGQDVRKRDNDRLGVLPFRHIPHLQRLLSQRYQGEPERLFSGCGFIQPLCRTDAEGVLSDDAFHEAVRLRQMYRHHVCGQHHDSRVPQYQEVYEQGFRRSGQRRERHDGMVPRLQAASAVQRFWRHHNLLPDRGERGRKGRKGMAGFHQGTLREGLRRQGVYQEGTFRITLRPRHSSRTRSQGQYEEQAHAHVG